jgi:hypothetical protein|tara:strand:+ start:4924 stop:5352 length:429 start_codon:yes stop_codon:yes gene_type:complete
LGEPNQLENNMKYLSNYTENLQTELFGSAGAFFAFGEKQFNEQKQENTRYVSLGAGMICPKPNVDALIEGLESINANGIAADIAENGIKAIIHRELANHEAQITYDISDTVDKLADYPGITPEMIQAEFPAYYQHCVDNDYF